MIVDNLKVEVDGMAEFFREQIAGGAPTFPMWRVRGGDGNLYIVATPFTDLHSKRLSVLMIRHVCAAFRATSVVFGVEAWAADATDDPAVAELQPSQRSDRREIIMVHGSSSSGDQAHREIQFDRQPEGPPVFKDLPVSRVESWMFRDLFEWGDLSPASVELARRAVLKHGERMTPGPN
jgi:hypothetical protein